MVDGKKLTEEEYKEYQRQQQAAKEKTRNEAARLVRELGEAYSACSRFMEQNPELCQRVGDAEAREHELYEKLKQNLRKADEAPRCGKIREDGTLCGSPRVKGHNYCYAHERMLQARARKLELPALEDANSIQMAVMLVQRALIDEEISEKKAGLLLYSLQIAASNVKNTTFGEEDDEYLTEEMPSESEIGARTVRGRLVASSKYEEDQVEEEELTTETRRHGEEAGRRLPPMSAEEANLTTETRRHGEEAQPRAAVPHEHRLG